MRLILGTPRSKPLPGFEVRPLRSDDLRECAALSERVHGFARAGELRDALEIFAPLVAVRDGRITAYASAPTFWQLNHGVAETEEDMRALILGAGAVNTEPPAMLFCPYDRPNSSVGA